MSNELIAKDYKLAKPDRSFALLTLERQMSSKEAEHLWIKLCDRCGFEIHTEEINELEIIYKAMSKMGGKIGVSGSALVVRIMSYKLLKGS